MSSKSDSKALPKNWPAQIYYLTAPVYSSNLTSEHVSVLRSRPHDALPIPSSTLRGAASPLVKIKPVEIPTHPAHNQQGLFAARDLRPGSFILLYIGVIHSSTPPSSTSDDPHPSSNYDLSLDREHGIGIDGERAGNEARFINDYRGVSEKPNAEFKEVWDERRGERGMGVWVWPEGRSGKGKGIRKGEEILVSYGRGFWGARRQDDDMAGQ